jgi:curved DNA-binding protein CbpA
MLPPCLTVSSFFFFFHFHFHCFPFLSAFLPHLRKVGEAYEVLSDTQKRRVYDQFGHAGLERGSGVGGGGFQGFTTNRGGGGGGFSQREEGFDFFEELFRNSGFGHSAGFGQQRQARRPKSPPIEKVIPLTLEELYTGCTKRVKVVRRVAVSSSRGLGEDVQTMTEVIPVEIAKGYYDGLILTSTNAGDELPGRLIEFRILFTGSFVWLFGCFSFLFLFQIC